MIFFRKIFRYIYYIFYECSDAPLLLIADQLVQRVDFGFPWRD